MQAPLQVLVLLVQKGVIDFEAWLLPAAGFDIGYGWPVQAAIAER